MNELDSEASAVLTWSCSTVFSVQTYTSTKENINLCPTFWDVFDEGSGPSGHPANEGPGPSGQAFIGQPEEVRHAVADAAHEAGRAAQDLQRAHHPTWEVK